MKNRFNRCVFLLGGLLLTASCHRHSSQDDVVIFAPDAAIPDYQSKPLQTYQLSDKGGVDENAAIESAKQLVTVLGEENNFDLSNRVKDGDRVFFVNKQDPSSSCTVNLRTGDITANAGTKNYMGNESTAGLLKQEEAIRMTKEYVQRLKYADFSDASLVQGHVGGVNMGVHDEQNRTQVFEKFTTVRFDRQLDSIPVMGHSRIIVQLAEKGKLHGMVRQWNNYEGSAVTREAEAMPEEVRKSIATHVMDGNKNAKKITVKKVNLVYYESRGVIEPALHVICEVQLPKSKTDSSAMIFPYDIVEPVLKSPRMTYTFMAEQHKDQPGQKDEVNTKEPPKRGEDEQKQQGF